MPAPTPTQPTANQGMNSAAAPAPGADSVQHEHGPKDAAARLRGGIGPCCAMLDACLCCCALEECCICGLEELC
ncbi:hypothetical protein Q5752_002590 [Cryptotrichosporon argae]